MGMDGYEIGMGTVLNFHGFCVNSVRIFDFYWWEIKRKRIGLIVFR